MPEEQPPVPLSNPFRPSPIVIPPETLMKVETGSPQRVGLWIGIVIVLLAVAGGVAYAYYQQIGPFSVKQYTEATFVTDVLAKSAQITSVSYNVSASLAVNPRESDAMPFAVPALDPAVDTPYKNDSDKMLVISKILSKLKSTYGEQWGYTKTGKYAVTRAAKLYPTNLSADIIASANAELPKGAVVDFSYDKTEGGKDFVLTATFETQAAISKIKNAYDYASTTTRIDGQKVTFTKESNQYYYLSSTAPRPLLVQFADMTKTISPDVSGNLALGATTDFTTGGVPDWHLTFTASGDLGDLSYAIDVEALRKDKNYYVRVNKMPALFGSLATYKGQWFVITPEAASSTLAYVASGIVSAETEYKKNRADATTALQKLATLADKDHLFVFKSPPTRDTVNGRGLYRYQLDMNKDAVVTFYKDVMADPTLTKPYGINDPGLLDYLKSKDFDDIFSYLKKNVFVTLWTDKAGFPAMLEYRLRVVPPDTATQLKGKQIDISFKLSFTDINKPVNIQVPADAKPIQDVIDEIEKNNNPTQTMSTTTLR